MYTAYSTVYAVVSWVCSAHSVPHCTVQQCTLHFVLQCGVKCGLANAAGPAGQTGTGQECSNGRSREMPEIKSGNLEIRPSFESGNPSGDVQ